MSIVLARPWMSVVALGLAIAANAHADERRDHPTPPMTNRTMKIELTANGKTAVANLVDSSTAREFIALLPMTLTLEDYASTEKISSLPRRLSTDSAPSGITPLAGDLAYYAPWGNLALFYRDFRYSDGLVRLGRVETGLDALLTPTPLEVVIKRVER